MKFVPLIALIFLASCAAQDRYPVSGEECEPGDPVLTLDAADCAVPTLG